MSNDEQGFQLLFEPERYRLEIKGMNLIPGKSPLTGKTRRMFEAYDVQIYEIYKDGRELMCWKINGPEYSTCIREAEHYLRVIGLSEVAIQDMERVPV
tara:strand:+ start:3549 stop:3842 length:294 start_codon:yes stop_codon:yes gene_type:complete